MFHWLEYHS